MKKYNYILPQKSDLHQIKVSDINFQLPDLKNISESKAITIAKWLMSWIDSDRNIQPNFLLPSKPELAYLLGVSIGTIQNALRYIEDFGYVESKQCIGTIIRDRSKKEILCLSLVMYIVLLQLLNYKLWVRKLILQYLQFLIVRMCSKLYVEL